MEVTSIRFSDTFGRNAYPGQEIETEFNGIRFVAKLHRDDDSQAPWEESEGHGPVSDWTRRAKRPGEVIVSMDGGSYRYYDLQEACRLARQDGWGAPFYSCREETGAHGLRRLRADWYIGRELHSHATAWHDDINAAHREARDAMRDSYPSARAYHAAAAMADCEALRLWCDDQWFYVGVAVQAFYGDTELTGEFDCALWRVECNYPNSDNSYLVEVANEQLEECAKAAKSKIRELHRELGEFLALFPDDSEESGE
jgi:hypothetical protein